MTSTKNLLSAALILDRALNNIDVVDEESHKLYEQLSKAKDLITESIDE